MEFKRTEELKNLDLEKVREELKVVQKKLVELKFKKSIDRITDTSQFKKLRRYIAKLLTFLHMQERAKVKEGAAKE